MIVNQSLRAIAFFIYDVDCQRDQIMTNKHVQWAYFHEVWYRLKPNEVPKISMPSYELQVWFKTSTLGGIKVGLKKTHVF